MKNRDRKESFLEDWFRMPAFKSNFKQVENASYLRSKDLIKLYFFRKKQDFHPTIFHSFCSKLKQ